ncbi:hypothetical protein [Paraburkholderia sp. J7]|uniref:hypothetical protein n=1 Tax=Paraburkholderia sp. J7 TaxID=2805438 RepID=UPI002AB656E6|nr:hypothetical protein [Paraburkholderia sp. J7]
MAEEGGNNTPGNGVVIQTGNDQPLRNGIDRVGEENANGLGWRRFLTWVLYCACVIAAVLYLFFWPSFNAAPHVAASAGVHAGAPGQTAPSSLHPPKAASASQSERPLDTFRKVMSDLLTDEQEETSFQGVFVLALTFLAFLMHGLESAGKKEGHGEAATAGTSRLRRWAGNPHVRFAVPTLIFFAAMIRRSHDDAAVFLMAVLAIYVAAEHFVALQQQHATARSILWEMSQQAEEIKKHTSGLGALQTDLKRRATEVGDVIAELNRQVGSIRNSLGTPYSQRQLYKAYGVPVDPRRAATPKGYGAGIYAVYRLLDIDGEWLDAPRKQKWPLYFDKNPPRETLYSALMRGRRDRVLIITDMPLRLVKPWSDASEPDRDRATDFLRFIGLVWHTVVLEQAARDLQAEHGVRANYDVRVGDSSNWMHVVDGTVYQLLGKPPGQVYLRDLTLDITREGERTGMNLVNWAVEDIMRSASRAASARDYICAVFSQVLMIRRLYQMDLPLLPGIVDQILLDIGFGDWLQFQDGFVEKWSETDAKTVFRGLIEKFLVGLADDKGTLTASLIYRELQ